MPQRRWNMCSWSYMLPLHVLYPYPSMYFIHSFKTVQWLYWFCCKLADPAGPFPLLASVGNSVNKGLEQGLALMCGEAGVQPLFTHTCSLPGTPSGWRALSEEPWDSGKLPCLCWTPLGLLHLCPSFLVVALNLVVALRTHIKLINSNSLATLTCCCLFSKSCLTLLWPQGLVAHQAPLFVGFPRQEY